MAISMRLSRDRTKRAFYRIVVADTSVRSDGKIIERIGTYNPLLAKGTEKQVVLDVERAKHWLNVGAQPTDRVLRFLDAAGIMERGKRDKRNMIVRGESAKERRKQGAEPASGIQETYLVSVGLDIDDAEALAKLATSAQRFMKFFGYSTEVELVSVE
jgi:small subunit ribosomal protein S16